jgi:ATP-dependent DNA helicase DinG
MGEMSTKRARAATMRDFFGPGGWLAANHARYEFRQGQLEMAELVERALREKSHLVVEAGTGTGKTLAYLVPALLSGQRVVVSTGTKNLQEQLFFKDIPFLEKHLGQELRVCYMKGRGNYLCREKLQAIERDATLGFVEQPRELKLIAEWAQKTESGDRAELASLPESSEIWKQLDARRDTCTGQKCAQFDRCFLTEMHRRAVASDLIIVNHHLFFADLALKKALGERVPDIGIIPEYGAVIFDEAHELEDVATQYFGRAVSNHQLEELVRDCEFALRTKDGSSGTGPEAATPEGLDARGLYQALGLARDRGGALFDVLSAGPQARTGYARGDAWLERHASTCDAAVNALQALESALAATSPKPETLQAIARRATEFRRDLEFLLEAKQNGFVFWLERRGRGVFLQATPIDVSPILTETLFERVPVCVLTSATLTVGGSFEFVRRRLGLRYARERALESHFDYSRQALLYVPPDLPDPRSPGFASQAAAEVCRLLEATRGRAFVLFTSHAQMKQVYELAGPELSFPLLIQGAAPRTVLLDRFRSLPNAVLFATSSFWQGVDVPGEQLSCVIIDRLPFAVPSDPVIAARVRSIAENGGEPFTDYQVPQAVLSLKQGFGRLIRSRSDRGVLAILDTRILSKNYGTIFFESLPGYHLTRDISEVERFMGKESGSRC